MLNIIFEDTDFLVINKPADLVCHPTKGDAYSSVIGRVRMHLGSGAEAHMVHRLDRETSGVMIIAKRKGAASLLHHLWRERLVRKGYLAIVHGWPTSDDAVIDAPLGKDMESRIAIKDCVCSDGVEASTQFFVERRFFKMGRSFALLRVEPMTGRKHQIRIHLAHIGHPIVGDKIYGGDEDTYLSFVQGRMTEAQRSMMLLPNHALHARDLRFTWHGRQLEFVAEPESWFTAFLEYDSMNVDPNLENMKAQLVANTKLDLLSGEI